MKEYDTCTCGKYFRTAHCIVNLYRSVSRRDMTPSGYGEESLKSMAGGVVPGAVELRAS